MIESTTLWSLYVERDVWRPCLRRLRQIFGRDLRVMVEYRAFVRRPGPRLLFGHHEETRRCSRRDVQDANNGIAPECSRAWAHVGRVEPQFWQCFSVHDLQGAGEARIVNASASVRDLVSGSSGPLGRLEQDCMSLISTQGTTKSSITLRIKTRLHSTHKVVALVRNDNLSLRLGVSWRS